MGGAPGETPRVLVEVDVTVLGLVGGAPGGEAPRVADSSAAGAGRFFHNSVPQGSPYPLASVLQAASNCGAPEDFELPRL